MSHLPDIELQRLRIVAGEIIATMEVEGSRVGTATSGHASFQEGRGPTGQLERALVKFAARRGASLASMHPEPVSGGLDLVSMGDEVVRRYRLKSARYKNGAPHIVCGERSSLLSTTDEPGFWPVEKWVLCFATDDDSVITEIFAAEIVGHEGEGPVQLILGARYPLDPITPPDGFIPDHDDDLGSDFDNDLDEGEADIA
jgi:hypothetical protein